MFFSNARKGHVLLIGTNATRIQSKSIASPPSTQTGKAAAPLPASRSGPGFAPSLGAQIPQSSEVGNSALLSFGNVEPTVAQSLESQTNRPAQPVVPSTKTPSFVAVKPAGTAIPVPAKPSTKPGPAGLDPACSLPRDPGPCANFVQRW